MRRKPWHGACLQAEADLGLFVLRERTPQDPPPGWRIPLPAKSCLRKRACLSGSPHPELTHRPGPRLGLSQHILLSYFPISNFKATWVLVFLLTFFILFYLWCSKMNLGSVCTKDMCSGPGSLQYWCLPCVKDSSA